jgi:hypothetical protein
MSKEQIVDSLDDIKEKLDMMIKRKCDGKGGSPTLEEEVKGNK